MSTFDVPPSPTFSNEDTITSEELFNSFMDVALAAEEEHKHLLTGDHATVDMPLPLLLKKSATPIYECVTDIPKDSVLRSDSRTGQDIYTRNGVGNGTNKLHVDLVNNSTVVSASHPSGVDNESPTPPLSPSYDETTADELFDSLMSVALSAERQQNIVGDVVNGGNVSVRGNDVDMPLPLLLKSANPIYEVVDNNVVIDKPVRDTSQQHSSTSSKSMNSNTNTRNSIHKNNTESDVTIAKQNEKVTRHHSAGRPNKRNSNTIVTVSPTVKTFPQHTNSPEFTTAKVGVKRYELDDNLKPFDTDLKPSSTLIESYQQHHLQKPQSPSSTEVNDLYAAVDFNQKRLDREAAAKHASLEDITKAIDSAEENQGYFSKDDTSSLDQQHAAIRHYSKDGSDYAIIDKHLKTKNNPSTAISKLQKTSAIDKDYEDITALTSTVFKSSNGNISNIQRTSSDTLDDEVDSYESVSHARKNNTLGVMKTSNSDYEDLNDILICDKRKVTKVNNLSPEVVAFGMKRLHTEGQSKLYQSCLNSIERGARWGSMEKKKTFFHFGKSKRYVVSLWRFLISGVSV